jgi:hypothetical protein
MIRPRQQFENGALDGTRTHTLPADNGLLFYSATRANGGKRWTTIRVSEQRYLGNRLVAELGVQTLHSSLLTLFCDAGFTDQQPERSPWWPCASSGSGSGSRTHLNEFMRLISVLWSSFPQCIEIGGVRRVTLPLGAACKAGASLFSHGPTMNL